MNTYRMVYCVCVLSLGAMSLTAAGRNSPDKRISQEERFYRDAEQKLDQQLFGAGDLEACNRRLARAKGQERQRLLIILSRYYRRMDKDPVKSLDVMSEVLLAKDQANDWKRGRNEAERRVLEQWRAACQKARDERAEIPPRPSGLALPFPSSDKWTVDLSDVGAVIEVAHAHMNLGLWTEALRIADLLGRKYEGITRVLAGECAADAMMGMSRFGQAVELYRFALNGFPTLCSYDGKLPPEYVPIKQRIEASLQQALRQLEIEKYGLGYVLYRDARIKQIKGKAYLEAFLLYEDLAKKLGQTVYAEAGRVYANECLLRLAEPDEREPSQMSIRAALSVLQEENAKLVQMKRAKVPEGSLVEMEKHVARAKQQLGRLQAVPSGKEAATLAGQRVMDFVKENTFGLYRGESLVECASYAFDRKLDSSSAERFFRQAWAWLEKVEKVDAKLDAYEVPSKARGVSAPPGKEEKSDFFGNIKRVSLPPGAIVNRKTCTWYLNDLRERCALALGFLEFAKGNKKESCEWYARVVNLDSKTGYLQSKGEWNDYKRLKWGADHDYLFAHPEELALFKGRRRFAVLMGDFYYCTERFSKAAHIYERLLAGEFGPLSGAAADYPKYAHAACMYWTQGRAKAFEGYMKVLENRNNTFTEDRAAYSAGKISAEIPNGRIRANGLQLLAELAGSRRKNVFVYRAMVVYGTRLIDSGQKEQGVKVLRKIPQSSGGYHEIAKFYLEEIFKIDKKPGHT